MQRLEMATTVASVVTRWAQRSLPTPILRRALRSGPCAHAQPVRIYHAGKTRAVVADDRQSDLDYPGLVGSRMDRVHDRPWHLDRAPMAAAGVSWSATTTLRRSVTSTGRLTAAD